MTGHQRQEPLTRSSSKDIEPTSALTSTAGAVSQQSKPGKETQYEAHLRDLQQYICELLIKNQQLRWLLETATEHQCEDLVDDCDQNFTRH